MTGIEAISYIENYTWSMTRLGLERTQILLRALGDPQKHLKFVHVAGSNGKGSTCAMLASILQTAGYRTGLYTSPYIEEFCERIQIDGENIPEKMLAAIVTRLRAVADSVDGHPSRFRLVTAAAIECFCEETCDLGPYSMRGRHGQRTEQHENCWRTGISRYYQHWSGAYRVLGDTLDKIAAAIAEIIETGCKCVRYDGEPAAASKVQSILPGRERGIGTCKV